jgi:hypothetical protein
MVYNRNIFDIEAITIAITKYNSMVIQATSLRIYCYQFTKY